MRKALLALAVASVAAIAWAQGPGTRSTAASMGSHLVAEVVSTDAASKTITVKAVGAQGPTAESTVLSVGPKAVAALKGVRAGDAVSLTCQTRTQRSAQAPSAAKPLHEFGADCASVTAISKE